MGYSNAKLQNIFEKSKNFNSYFLEKYCVQKLTNTKINKLLLTAVWQNAKIRIE